MFLIQMTENTVSVRPLKNPAHSYTNRAYLGGDSSAKCGYWQIHSAATGKLYWILLESSKEYAVNELAMNMPMRTDYGIVMGTPTPIKQLSEDSDTFISKHLLTDITATVNTNPLSTVERCFPAHEFAETIKTFFRGIPVYFGVRYGFQYHEHNFIVVFTANTELKTNWGFISDNVIPVGSNAKIKFDGPGSATSKLFKGQFNFKEMGIGGLDSEFETIFRRVLISRAIPAAIRDAMGIKHVKGFLLHGPPGSGKTLIARNIGKILNCVQGEPVLGPSLLGRYVGESEENVRKLFAPAISNPSALHLIICDEFDAICKKRGSHSDSTGVHDNVVNQLLSMIDGPTELDNVILICTTNRIDLIDEAALRPGRLEVQIETHLPDEHGRVDILAIHSKTMASKGYLDSTVDLSAIATLTKNYTGAELESVVKSAASIALSRQIDPAHLDVSLKRFVRPVLTQDDFILALKDIKPAFGTGSAVLDYMTATPFQLWSSQLCDIHHRLLEQMQHVRRGCNLNVLITGEDRCGKTKLACDLAKHTKIECIKFINAEELITSSDRGLAIFETFKRTSATDEAILIIDGLEYIIEYSPLGNLYNNKTLQVLFAIMNSFAIPGKKLIIITTSSNEYLMKNISITKLMNVAVTIDDTLTPDCVTFLQREGFVVEDTDTVVSDVFDRAKFTGAEDKT